MRINNREDQPAATSPQIVAQGLPLDSPCSYRYFPSGQSSLSPILLPRPACSKVRRHGQVSIRIHSSFDHFMHKENYGNTR